MTEASSLKRILILGGGFGGNREIETRAARQLCNAQTPTFTPAAAPIPPSAPV